MLLSYTPDYYKKTGVPFGAMKWLDDLPHSTKDPLNLAAHQLAKSICKLEKARQTLPETDRDIELDELKSSHGDEYRSFHERERVFKDAYEAAVTEYNDIDHDFGVVTEGSTAPIPATPTGAWMSWSAHLFRR